MNLRIKKIRNDFSLTQQQFADKLGIKRGAIANYEIGRNEPIDAVIALICDKFNVNEEWLRNGNGEPYIAKSRSDTIAEFAGKLMKDEEESFRRRLTEALAKLNEDEWELLENIAKSATKKD